MSKGGRSRRRTLARHRIRRKSICSWNVRGWGGMVSSRAIDDNELRYIIPEWEEIYCHVRQDGGVVRVACQTEW